MFSFLLLLIAMLCRARAGVRASLRHVGLTGMLLAMGLAIHDRGFERGLAAWVATTLACGALAPMILLMLESFGRRPAWLPAALRRHWPVAVK